MAANALLSFRRQVIKVGEQWIGEVPFVATLADGRELHMLAHVRTDRHHPAARYARRVIARTSGKMPAPNVWLEVRLDPSYPYPEEIVPCYSQAHAQARHWADLLAEFSRTKPRTARQEKAGQHGLIAALARDVCPRTGHKLTLSVYAVAYANLRPKEYIYYGDPPRVTITSPVKKLELLPLPH